VAANHVRQHRLSLPYGGGSLSALGSEPSALAALTPDLFLLDLCFGDDSTGTTLLERLNAAPSTTSVPVLVDSAHQTLLKGCHDQLVAWDFGILPNPFNLEGLLTVIQTGLATREPGMASVRGER
jgi:CheY-like chemotaxis protein